MMEDIKIVSTEEIIKNMNQGKEDLAIIKIETEKISCKNLITGRDKIKIP